MTSPSLTLPDPGLPLPRGRSAWGALALAILVLAVSSTAPFVELAPGGPTLGRDDLVAVIVYVVTWMPFVALVAFLTGRYWRRESITRWIAHLAFLLTLPAVHASAFVELIDWLQPRVASPDGLADMRVRVLTLLGTLQYLVVASAFLAVFAGRAAGRERLRAARLDAELAEVRSRERQPEPPAAAASPRRIPVRQDGRVTLISPSEIDWVEATGNYVQLHCRGGTLRHRATMAELEAMLGPGFTRIRRSVLVRAAAIRYCESWGKGSWIIVLGDQTKLTSSRYYRERLEGLLGR